MSSISIDIPTLQIHGNDLQNFLGFIYKHEDLLKKFGAIKVQSHVDCKFAIKKRSRRLPSHPVMKQIVQTNDNTNVYFVEAADHADRSTQKRLAGEDECSFWSTLSSSKNTQRHLNISFSPETSLFSEKPLDEHFSLHRIPRQSLLRLGGTKLTRHFAPCMRRAHGPGAVFPLASAQHNLFSVDYHHIGGDHQWYIIPNSEREALQKLVGQQNSPFSLDHGQCFIDPSVLDEKKIRYHRAIQRPGEFLVLSAGSLAQSFAHDTSWSETVLFALPSWVEEGYANLPFLPCRCSTHQNTLSDTIDLTYFRQELIRRYVRTYLETTKNPSAVLTGTDSPMMQTQNNMEVDSPDIAPSWHALPTPPTTSIVDSCVMDSVGPTDHDSNADIICEVLDEGIFGDTPDSRTTRQTLANCDVPGDKCELDVLSSQLCSTTDAVTNFNAAKSYLSYDELLNLISPTADFFDSPYTPTDANLHMLEDELRRLPSNSSIVTEIQPLHQHGSVSNETHNHHKILFMSRLKNDVTLGNIRRHFVGSVKVTLKRYRTASHLKYAFIVHRTSEEAERNLQRPIDHHLFGSQSRVEYANECSSFANSRQTLDKRKVVITRIPENVTKEDLCRLFTGCCLLKYCPARTLDLSVKSEQKKRTYKISLGYAVISFCDEQQAAKVSSNAGQYEINGQPLVISLYRKQRYVSSAVHDACL